jgi:hypothetical protein
VQLIRDWNPQKMKGEGYWVNPHIKKEFIENIQITVSL